MPKRAKTGPVVGPKLAAARLLAAGFSKTRIASMLGFERRSIARWEKQAPFCAAVAEAEAAIADRARCAMDGLIDEAYDELGRLMRDKDARVRLGAVQTVVRNTLSEKSEVEATVDANVGAQVVFHYPDNGRGPKPKGDA